MAFIDIKDPQQRDRIVADYLSIIKGVQQENEDKKAIGLARQVNLEKTFNPIIKATEMSTKAITKEIKDSNKRSPPATALSVPRKRTWDVSNGLTAIDYYLNKYGKKNLDKYYGIQQDGDKLMMGDKEVTVDEHSNISVDNKTYNGTPGLWSLIMSATPKEYTDEDFDAYRDLVKRTDVMQHPRSVVEGISRPTQTYKRKTIFTNLMRDGEEIEEEQQDKKVVGEGIQFLPGDIKGLNIKLNLLLAEYVAGNRSSLTRNEIVGILDELKRRKRIPRKEYTDINSFLAKTL